MKARRRALPHHVKRVASLWMAICVNEEGREDGCAVPKATDFGVISTPLMTTDEAGLPWLRTEASRLAKLTGADIKIIRMSRREDLEIYPGGPVGSVGVGHA